MVIRFDAAKDYLRFRFYSETATYLANVEVQSHQEDHMPVMCFQKKDSLRPICGVHGALLLLHRIPIDSNAPGLGHIDCLVCSVSRAVVEERKQNPSRNLNLNRFQITA